MTVQNKWTYTKQPFTQLYIVLTKGIYCFVCVSFLSFYFIYHSFICISSL